jgi:pimeloyl-ACP methyl ester carboxylesterase
MNHILLLHGAIGAASQLQPLLSMLENDFKAHTLNFNGHGGNAFGNAFSIEQFATEVADYIQDNKLEYIHIFGYSMGGYVAMYLATKYPDLVKSICTLATKFYWDEAVAAKEIKMLAADKIEEKLPAFAKELEQRHAPNNWKDLLGKTKEMLIAMGNNNPLKTADYSTIIKPVLLMLGDRDKMVSLEETVTVYKALPNAQMAVLPGTPHPLEQVDMEQLAYQIKKFAGSIYTN